MLICTYKQLPESRCPVFFEQSLHIRLFLTQVTNVSIALYSCSITLITKITVQTGGSGGLFLPTVGKNAQGIEAEFFAGREPAASSSV
jgi:hypothetical protein